MSKRAGFLTTHPVQYQVPWIRELAARPGIDLTVYYCFLPTPRQQGKSFGVEFAWDIPLLEGYKYKVLNNLSEDPGSHHYSGCVTPEIKSIIHTEKFDAFIIHGWLVKSCLQALAACRREQVPCIIRGESNNLRPRPFWKRAVHRLLLKRYSAFLSIGKLNRDYYMENGVPSSKIFHSPYCIENDRFAAEAKNQRQFRSKLRESFGIAPDKVVFLFCGKLLPKKHPEDILQAAKALVAQGIKKFHILIVGDGELRERCEAITKQFELPVTFAGFINQRELPKIYMTSDCLILPSNTGETWGLVVNEAMACGLAVIVSDQVGCWPDLVSAGQNGEVFHCGNIHALRDAMKKLIDNPTLLDSMKHESLRIIQRFSIKTSVDGVEEALNYVAPTSLK